MGVMLRPLRGSPDHLMSGWALGVIAGLFAVMVSPTLFIAIAAYWVAGIINAYFFAATLAARAECAPTKGRGQVFLWVAAMKITAGSAGTAAAGVMTGWGVRLPLMVGIGLIGCAVALSFVERCMARS